MNTRYQLENSIAKAATKDVMVRLFLENHQLLRNHTFLFFDNTLSERGGIKLPDYLNKTEDGVCATTLSSSNGCFILNEKFIRRAASNKLYHVPFAFGYRLDLQMMNLFHDYFHQTREIPLHATKIFDKLCHKELSFDWKPYLLENYQEINTPENRHHIEKTLLPIFDYKRNGKAVDNNFKFSKKSQTAVSELISTVNTSKEMFEQDIWIHQLTYCLLLNCAILSEQKNLSIHRKMTQLLNLVNFSTGVNMERELVLCYWFLKQKNDHRILKFFKKVQVGTKDILKTVSGMAWDLTHLRGLTNSQIPLRANAKRRVIPFHKEIIFIDSLVTRDTGLMDVIKAYPIRCLILVEGESYPRVIWETPIENVIKEVNVAKILTDNDHIRSIVREERRFLDIIPALEKDAVSIFTR